MQIEATRVGCAVALPENDLADFDYQKLTMTIRFNKWNGTRLKIELEFQIGFKKDLRRAKW
jgi:hypothetical protein